MNLIIQKIKQRKLEKEFESDVKQWYPYLLNLKKDEFPLCTGYDFIRWYTKNEKEFTFHSFYPIDTMKSATRILNESKETDLKQENILYQFNRSYENNIFKTYPNNTYLENMFKALEFYANAQYFSINRVDFITAATKLKTDYVDFAYGSMMFLPGTVLNSAKEKGMTADEYVIFQTKSKIDSHIDKYFVSEPIKSSEQRKNIYSQLEEFALKDD
jgi:hypothetical protein